MEHLKNTLYAYKNVDNEIHAMTQQIAELRAQRKNYETTLANILARPEFSEIKKLEISEDNSYVLIHRPDTWTKPWSLSKKELESCLTQYFAMTHAPTSQGCFEFICANQKKLGKEFTFDRIVRKNE